MNPLQSSIIRFSEEGLIKEIASTVKVLRKENNEEVLYTTCGSRIALGSIVSFNGISFS